MKEVNIISKVVGRSGAEASPSSAIMPNMSGYATKTELNTLRDEFNAFLEGDDADVIINKWQDLVSFLEGISEDFDLLSMLGLKADKSELSNYVTIATEQPIRAHKDFLNGLSIGGLPITKSQDDVIYLDANLVVRGGITMFGANSVDVPTIMDAIATDGTNLKVVNGVLTFVGSIDGGEAGSVAWENVEGKPSWIGASKPSYAWSEITGKPSFASVATSGKYSDLSGTPTLLSSFTDDVVAGKYLPLSGGVINGRITTEGRIVIRNSSPIQFVRGDNKEILLGLYSQSSNDLYYYNGGTWGKVWTAANDGSGSGLDADTLDGLQPSALSVLSASKLTTARTIWGQSFDGSGDVSGTLTLGYNSIIGGGDEPILGQSTGGYILLGLGTSKKGFDTYIDGYNTRFRYGTASTEGMRLTSAGNVLIGTTTDSGYKLDVNGTIHAYSNVRSDASIYANNHLLAGGYMFLGNGEEGVYVTKNGVAWHDSSNSYVTSLLQFDSDGSVNIPNKLKVSNIPIYKSQDDVLYIDGNLAVRGGITMYATDAIDVPSIIDALPIASASAKGIAAFNPNDFSIVDGYVSFIGKSGVDESVLADYAKKTDLSNYLPLSGGELSNTEYVLTINRLENEPAWIQFKSNWEVQGSIGAYNNSLLWMDKNFNTHTILHSGNWSQYVSVTGSQTFNGTLLINGSNALESYPALKFHIANVNWSQFLMDGAGDIHLVSGSSQASDYRNLRVGTLYPRSAKSFIFPNGESFDQYGNVWLGISSDDGSWNVFNSKGIALLSVFGYSYIRVNADFKMGKINSCMYMVNSNGVQEQFLWPRWENDTYLNFGSNGHFYIRDNNSNQCVVISTGGNLLAYGGITMYSDVRKKTKLQDVELTLQQIAEAPLIEHYYNSDEKRTTHVGSIAQYWASMNDWFCKLDSEGFYTMEIQNAALASAISIARELVKYESKTDRKIRLLKQRVKELEEKIEKLENN